LKECGALTLDGDGLSSGKVDQYDGVVTSLGKMMKALPLDVQLSRLIMLGFVFGVPEDAISIACLSSVENVVKFVPGKELEAWYSRFCWSSCSFSDSIALLDAYKVSKAVAASWFCVFISTEVQFYLT
jgi:ATP-dependent RNA helicase TDRD9